MNDRPLRKVLPVRRFDRIPLSVVLLVGMWCVSATLSNAQDAPQTPTAVGDGIERPAPPPLDDFETDANSDGVPDGWYNPRDAAIISRGGVVGPRFLRFHCERPGRPSRLSRAFGVDGSKYDAIVIGLWVRVDKIQAGERIGDEPSLMIDFLGEKLRQTTRGSLGPWNVRTMVHHPNIWTRVAKRIAVPSSTRDAIMTVGLLGSTGVLDIDGLTIELQPIGGTTAANLVRNPDFELGDPNPSGWVIEGGARRCFPGDRSNSGLEMSRAGCRAMSGLAIDLGEIDTLAVKAAARGTNLRESGGASATLFFLDDAGRVLPEFETGVQALSWSGSFEWEVNQAEVEVPARAARAVLQIEKTDGVGTIRIDDVSVTSSPRADAGRWLPDHVTDDVKLWMQVPVSNQIEPGSALDFTFLNRHDPANPSKIVVKKGRLHDENGKRVRFFGIQFLAPLAFPEKEQADALADRLARSGVNLVRISDLDAPFGPDRSLFDDTRDDTSEFDPIALAKLDHLLAALSQHGIYHAIELAGGRRFREDDKVKGAGGLPPGGGPALFVDPVLKAKTLRSAKDLLGHVNAETGIALKDDPMLAWVTLAGETSLFDLIDNPTAMPSEYLGDLRKLGLKSNVGMGRKFWQELETTQWTSEADALRKEGLKAPIAGVSHWRREPEFADALSASGLDLIDDRIFWIAPTWSAPDRRSMLWSLDGGLTNDVVKKRKNDRPYVLGQWCDYVPGLWSATYEAAEQILVAAIASEGDWDGLSRRGLFVQPKVWGSGPAGTGGGEDIYQVPEVANAAPQIFGFWPHAASLFLRPGDHDNHSSTKTGTNPKKGASRPTLPRGWSPSQGKLVIDTPHTQGIAGWPGGDIVETKDLAIEVESSYAVVMASSVNDEPLSKTSRVLVSAVARIQPTGFLWADPWKREVADPGHPPLLQEPVMGKLTWKRKGTFKVFALDNDGKQVQEVKTEPTNDGIVIPLDGTSPTIHWEIIGG